MINERAGAELTRERECAAAVQQHQPCTRRWNYSSGGQRKNEMTDLSSFEGKRFDRIQRHCQGVQAVRWERRAQIGIFCVLLRWGVSEREGLKYL